MRLEYLLIYEKSHLNKEDKRSGLFGDAAKESVKKIN